MFQSVTRSPLLAMGLFSFALYWNDFIMFFFLPYRFALLIALYYGPPNKNLEKKIVIKGPYFPGHIQMDVR